MAGISDIRVFVPRPMITLEEVVARRVEEDQRLARHLSRAVQTTGQRRIRFPEPWEDTVTMAAEAARAAMRSNDHHDWSGLRYLSVGTESGVDHSKPVSAYVQGALQGAGLPVPDTLSSFQVQHACAAGTVSLLSTSALLAAGGAPSESGLVIASDVARYSARSTAEITQGAGAVAILVENDPGLIALDLASTGYCSRDVDDFFRPNGQETPRVKGRYSIQVYSQNLEAAFLDHCRRRGEDPADVLGQTDLFVLHTPFRNMPELAMQRLLNRTLGLTCEEAEDFLDSRGFYAGIDPVADVGNIYTGSMYLCLASLLSDRFQVWGDSLVGRRILMASYGSGNTMIVLSGVVAPGAPEVLSRWDLGGTLRNTREAAFREYASRTRRFGAR